MRRRNRCLLVVIFVTLLGIMAPSGTASAEEKPPPPSTEESVVLKKEPTTAGVSEGTLTEAELVFENCAIASEGKLTVNKQNNDKAELTKVGPRESSEPNCETHVGEERITEAIVSTYYDDEGHGGGSGENGALVFKGNMKYRTTSPKCTYATIQFKAEFVIQGWVETTSEMPMTSTALLVSGESEAGCSPSATVHAKGILAWGGEGKFDPYYAERKSEK
jgi:hypothetical protein